MYSQQLVGIQMLRDSGWKEEDGSELSEYEDLSTRAEQRLGQLVREKYKTDYYILGTFFEYHISTSLTHRDHVQTNSPLKFDHSTLCRIPKTRYVSSRTLPALPFANMLPLRNSPIRLISFFVARRSFRVASVFTGHLCWRSAWL